MVLLLHNELKKKRIDQGDISAGLIPLRWKLGIFCCRTMAAMAMLVPWPLEHRAMRLGYGFHPPPSRRGQSEGKIVEVFESDVEK